MPLFAVLAPRFAGTNLENGVILEDASSAPAYIIALRHFPLRSGQEHRRGVTVEDYPASQFHSAVRQLLSVGRTPARRHRYGGHRR
jgi:hypothetical protein